MRATQHEKRCLDLLHASNVHDFKRQIVSFIQDLGFSTFGAMVVTDHSATLREFQILGNAPEAYLSDFENIEHSHIDPVMQHCKHSSSPLVWDRLHYSSKERRPLWEVQEPYGYRSGIAIGMHTGWGRHFVFGANWSVDQCAKVAHFKAIAEDVIAFAQHAQAAAFELTLPSASVPRYSTELSGLELEALRWTMDGLTSWDIARQMSISERHATLLLRRAMDKLGCGNKYQTGLRAIRLGLIDCQ
jgi:DNA-binding CsgD family transcriptional regulator